MSFTHTAIPTGRKGGYLARSAAVLLTAGLYEEEFMKMTYIEQLRRPEWQKMRLSVLNTAGWKCEQCGDDQTTLHVHHKRYIKGRMAWDYDMSNFEALCEVCHKDNHAAKERINMVLASIPGYMWDWAADNLVFWAWEFLPEATELPNDPMGQEIAELSRMCREKLSIYQIRELIEAAKAMPAPVHGSGFKD